MSSGTKVWTVLIGLVMIAAGAWLFYDPDDGLKVVAVVLSISCTLRGFQLLLYYLTMARHMVSGKVILYLGMVYLDVGVLTSAMIANARVYIILYLAVLHGFSGVVEILRSRERKNVGASDWKWTLVTGLTNLLIAAIAISAGMYTQYNRVVVYIYAAGLIYSACMRIVSAFRRTEIVYIQ